MKALAEEKGKRDRGFTLIELMIVIAIIGILASVAVPNFVKYRQRAYDISAKEDVVNVMKAYQSYRGDHPGVLGDTTALASYGFTQTEGVNDLLYNTADSPWVQSFHPKGSKYYYTNQLGILYTVNF